ncbi:MAG: hypothetical protein WEB85_08200 [Dongiaceae bacterium]
MKKTLLASAALAFASGFALSVVLTPTNASAGTATGACVRAGQAGFIAALDSPNDTEGDRLGDAIADGFFGNEPNLTDTDTNDDLGPEEVAPGSSAGFVVGSSSPPGHHRRRILDLGFNRCRSHGGNLRRSELSRANL